MSQLEKLLEKLRHTKVDVRFTGLEKVLIFYGYTAVRRRGSHVHFRKPGAVAVTIPTHNQKVKMVYVKQIIDLLSI